MTTKTDSDLTALLRAADPAGLESGGDGRARLSSIRGAIDAQRDRVAPAPQPDSTDHRWRTVAIVAAAAALLPVAAVVLVPGIATRAGVPWAAVIGPGVADRLACDGSGHATTIAPRDAPIRLWPSELPAGWSVESVVAHRAEGSGGCFEPSLVVASTAADGVVTATVKVIGPQRRISMPGDPNFIDDRVAGLPAQEVVYPGMERTDFRRWVVRGPGGWEWEVLANQFDQARVHEVVDRLSFAATHTTYRETPGSNLTVVHERTGQPYPNTSNGFEWYLNLRDDQGRDRQIWVKDSSLELPVASQAVQGALLYTLRGHPAMAEISSPGDHSLIVEWAPGVTTQMTFHGDLATVEQVLTTLVPLDRNDPRLVEYLRSGESVG